MPLASEPLLDTKTEEMFRVRKIKKPLQLFEEYDLLIMLSKATDFIREE